MIVAKNNLLIKKDFFYLFFILIFIIIFFNKIIFTDNNYFIGDIYSQFFPWKEFARNSIQSGSLPFWDPFTFSGFPFLADIQKGVFYPAGIIFLIFDFSTALKIFIITHFIIMGFSVFLFLRIFNFSRFACFFGSFIYMFNTFTVSKTVFFNAIGTLAFFPVLLFLIHKFIFEKKFYDFILLTLILCVEFLSGHPPLFFYCLIFAFVFFIFIVLQKEGLVIFLKKFLQYLFYLIMIMLLMFLITLPQAGLFYNLINNSTRINGISFNDATVDSVSFSSLFSFFMPAALNGINIDPNKDWLFYSLGIYNFFSVTFIFLFITSLFFNKNRLIYFCYTIFLLSILLALGKNTPIYSWFFAFFPGFSLLRHPGLAITLALIPITIIVSFAIDELKAASARQLSLFYSLKGFTNSENYVETKFSGKLFNIYIIFLIILIINIINYGNVIKIYNLTLSDFKNFILGFVFFLILFGFQILFLFLKENLFISRNFYFILLFLILFWEFYYFSGKINPVINSSIYNIEKNIPETVDLIKSSSFKFIHTDYARKMRIMSGNSIYEAQKNYLLLLPSNIGSLFKLYDAGGYNPIILSDYYKFCSDVFSGDDIINKEKLDLLNAKYIFSFKNEMLNYSKIYDGIIKIYKNPDAVPLFFMTEEKDKLKPIIIQTAWGRKNENDFNYYKIDLKTSKPGYFIFSNIYYPGWKAFVNNQSIQIEKCFDIYMGIKLDKGNHTVIFKYYPENFYIYTIIYYFTSLLLLCLAFFYYRYLTENF